MALAIKQQRAPGFMGAEYAINVKHEQLGGDAGFLGPVVKQLVTMPGYPPPGELKECVDKKGYYKTYKNGVIYFSPATGAHEVHGDILIKWTSLSREHGFLGYPLTDETGTPDGIGRFNRFQNGMIYWTPSTGAHVIHGDILSKWSSMGFERSLLGYPMTDELGTPDGIGRFNRFQNDMIYWTPTTGAFEVHGAILELWSSLGYETSQLGYPVSDETNAPDGGRQSNFQNGIIYWSAASGAYVVKDMQHFHSDITFDGGVALGGYFDLALTKQGEVSFSGHFHDSGADSYDTTLVVVLLTPGGLAYSIVHQGSTHGTFEPGSRDDDWAINQTNNIISEHWESQFSNAAYKWSAYAGSMIGADLVKFVSETAKELAAEFQKALAGAVVALIF